MTAVKSKFEVSLESGPHNQLAALTGSWTGVARTWFEKDVLADESPISGTITSILGGRFILHQYQGSMQGEPTAGMAIIGYSFDYEKFQTAWIDSFHMGTGIMFSEGWETGNGHSVLGSYGGNSMPEHWGWRTEIQSLGKDQIVITAFNIAPGATEEKATEIIYDRLM